MRHGRAGRVRGGSQVSPLLRAAAAETLDLLRAPEAVDDLDEIAQDPSAGQPYRHQTAKVTGAHILSRVAELNDAVTVARTRLFLALSMWPGRRIGSTSEEPANTVVYPQCLDTLFAFARDTAVGFKVRKAAASALTFLSDPRGPTLTEELSWPPEKVGVALTSRHSRRLLGTGPSRNRFRAGSKDRC